MTTISVAANQPGSAPAQPVVLGCVAALEGLATWPALFMGDHLARSVRGRPCAPPA